MYSKSELKPNKLCNYNNTAHMSNEFFRFKVHKAKRLEHTYLPVDSQDVRLRSGPGKPDVQFLVGSCKTTTLSVTLADVPLWRSDTSVC